MTTSAIFPAIDLMDGGCVRLFKGDFAQRTNYAAPPMDVVRSYAEQGAKWVHIVDLDGARDGNAAQTDLIIALAKKSGLKVQTGGGLRTLAQIKALLAGGVSRVVIGSLAVSDPDKVKAWMAELGADKFCLALDVEFDEGGTPFPTLKGWTEKSTRNLWDVIDDYQDTGVKTFLVTDISKDGVLQGSNVELYTQIGQRYSELDVITSGGVGSLDDVRALKAIKPYGIIIGKALYENKFTVAEAITC